MMNITPQGTPPDNSTPNPQPSTPNGQLHLDSTSAPGVSVPEVKGWMKLFAQLHENRIAAMSSGGCCYGN